MHSPAKVREISIGFGCLKFTGTGFERFWTTPPNRSATMASVPAGRRGRVSCTRRWPAAQGCASAFFCPCIKLCRFALSAVTHTGSAERYCVLCHTRRGANKAQLKLSERIPALPAHSLDEVKDIGFWIVFMNSWPLRSGQKVLT